LASTSTHATTRADLLTGSGTVFNGIGAVNGTSITRNTDITLLGADNRLAAYAKGELSAATGSTARILEAERGLRSSTLGVKSTSKALGASRSTEALKGRKSSIRSSTSIVTIVAVTRVVPLAVVRSSISGA